jgi:hypothetical protein
MLKSRVIGTYMSTKPFNTEFYQLGENMWGFLQRSSPVLDVSATPENCPANTILTYSSRRYLFNPPAVAGSPAQRPILLHRVKNPVTGMKGLINPNSDAFKKLDMPTDANGPRGSRMAARAARRGLHADSANAPDASRRGPNSNAARPRPNVADSNTKRPAYKQFIKDASGNFIKAMTGKWTSNSFRSLNKNINVSLGPLVVAAGATGDAVAATMGQIVVTNPQKIVGPLTVTIKSSVCKTTSAVFLTQASGPGAALSAVAADGSFTVTVPGATGLN